MCKVCRVCKVCQVRKGGQTCCSTRQVAELRGHAVYKVTGTRLVDSGMSSSKDDAK